LNEAIRLSKVEAEIPIDEASSEIDHDV